MESKFYYNITNGGISVENKLVATLIVGLFCVLFCNNIIAQELNIKTTKNLNYKQKVTPTTLDNYLFSTYYGVGKKCYNLKGFPIANLSKKIKSIKMNPAGASFAVISGNGNSQKVEIFEANSKNKKLHEFTNITNPLSIAYSSDSKSLFIATSSELHIYDTKTYQLKQSTKLPFVPIDIAVSNNDYYLAISGINSESVSQSYSVYILDIETKQIIQSLPIKDSILQISFSDDSSMLGALTYDELIVYSTRNFTQFLRLPFVVKNQYSSFAFHPEGKYLAMSSNQNNIKFLNLINLEESAYIAETDNLNSTKYIRFVKDGKQNIYLTYPTTNSIKYKMISGLSPNLTRMLREELLARMEKWSKIRDGETEEEYKLRVNEESRIIQARLFEQEIATRMAEDLVMNSTVTLGGYNPENNMLTLNFDNMPTVYLTVPEKEVSDFMLTENLEFRDAVYGLTKNDKFELIYANVYNKATGKTYEFNNLNRQSLDFLSAESEFVPIEIVQQSSMEEVKLNAIKKNVIEEAKKRKLISEHTNINVSTAVVSDYDALGNKITNYKVAFNYTVNAKYSAYEDFPAGKYKISESNAAESMLKIVAQAFETDFAQYIKAGKKVKVKITGSADALAINGTIAYDGRYGEYENEPCYIDNALSNITVTKKTGIKKNEQLAFIRATAVKDYIQQNVKTLNNMNTDYQYNIELSDKSGGKYRRINVEFTFINAF